MSSIYRKQPPRDVRIHDLKTRPDSFQASWDGEKPYEIRSDESDFKTGDVVRLREWEPTSERFTGRLLEGYVGHLTKVPHGLCVFALRDMWRAHESDDRPLPLAGSPPG